MQVDSGSGFKPHERPISRARTMYRIPTAPGNNRTLELHHTREPILAGFNWPGEGAVSHRLAIGRESTAGPRPDGAGDLHHSDYRAHLPYSDGSFDLVILHRTLDDLASSALQHGMAFAADPLLAQVARVLAPGGLVAGCVDNRTSLKFLTRRALRLVRGAGLPPPSSHFTLHGVRQLLRAAAFTDIRLFTLLANCDEPLKLVDVDPRLSRIAFRHELQIARPSWSLAGYVARRLAVELGLYPYLEESFCFWGYKPC